MVRFGLLLVLVAGCGTEARNAVSFRSSTGDGPDYDTCTCLYYRSPSGSEGLEVTCMYGPFRSSQFTIGAQGTMDHDIRILFSADDNGGTWRAMGTGSFSFLGQPHREKDGHFYRSVGGIELQWDAQNACDQILGCGINDKPVSAGAAHDGAGACDDVYATINQ